MSCQQYTINQVLEELEDDDGEEPGVEAQLFRGTNLSSDSTSSESENDEESNEQPHWTRRRNFATKSKRLVRCLSTALNPENYDEIPAIETIRQYTSFSEKPSPNAKTISWVNVKRAAVGRSPEPHWFWEILVLQERCNRNYLLTIMGTIFFAKHIWYQSTEKMIKISHLLAERFKILHRLLHLSLKILTRLSFVRFWASCIFVALMARTTTM